MPHDVFISYSTKDKLTADAVCGTLEARGIRCWIAPRDITPGMDWTDAIIDALTSARVFLLLLTGASNESEQVKRELQNAVSEGLPVVPVRIEDVSLSKHMRYFIGTPHWLDALTPPMEAHLEKLAQTVHALLLAADRNQARELLAGTEDELIGPEVDAPGEAPAKHEEPVAWNPDDLRKIERELAVFIGPMARVLVHQTARRSKDLEMLCREVSQYVPQDSERQQFIEATHLIVRCGTPSEPAPVVPAATQAAPQKAWDAETLQSVERQLAEYIGPLARLLVKRASQKATSLDELYAALAENISVPQEKQNFLKGRNLLR